MSLINDALKRAQQAQDKQTPNPRQDTPLHVAPEKPSSRLWPVALICLVLAVVVSAVGIWFLYKKPGLFKPAPLTVQAASPATATPGVIIIQPVKQTAPASPVQPPGAAPKPFVVQPLTPAQPPAAPKPFEVQPLSAMPDIPPPAAAATVTPPNIRVQGVLYRPDKPAAIINGRTVFVGDHVGDGTGDGVIKAITPTTVTVLWEGQLYVLHL
jgi:hypothetical protein